MDDTKSDSPYLTGKLLLAMPTLGDPRFHRAVIFMCAHDENGAMGLVVNHEMPDVNFSSLLEQIGLSSEITVDLKNQPLKVMSGGPVEPMRGLVLYSGEALSGESVHIGGDFKVTGTIESLREIVQGKGPEELIFVLGYSGWGAGQLEGEIKQNSWLVVDAEPEIIFNNDTGKIWERAVSKLGFDPAMLSGTAGRA